MHQSNARSQNREQQFVKKVLLPPAPFEQGMRQPAEEVQLLAASTAAKVKRGR